MLRSGRTIFFVILSVVLSTLVVPAKQSEECVILNLKEKYPGLDDLDIIKKISIMGTLDMSQFPNNASTGMAGKGVIAANVNSSSLADELIVDFGSLGVWIYDGVPWGSGDWHQISAANPTWIISLSWRGQNDEDIIASFGPLGLWWWNYSGYPGSWVQLTGATASTGFSLDDDLDGSDDIYVDFGSLGAWCLTHDNIGGLWFAYWLPLSGYNPVNYSLRSDLWTILKEEGVFIFPGLGVWNISRKPGFLNAFDYIQLTGTDAADDHVSAELGIGDGSEELVMDFGGLGIWLAQEGTSPNVSWVQISPNEPDGLREVRFDKAPDYDDYELICDFSSGPSGLWIWNYDAANWQNWTQIHTWSVGGGYYEPFNPNGSVVEMNADEEIAVDFETQGLWLYDHTDGSWTQLSPVNPVYMVRADLYGDGIKEILVVDFDTLGLWIYNGRMGSWSQISGISPD